MGDVVNLNKFRKERAREAARRAARGNRLRFGRTGAEKSTDRLTRDQADKALDGKKRGPGTTPESSEPPPDGSKPKAR